MACWRSVRSATWVMPWYTNFRRRHGLRIGQWHCLLSAMATHAAGRRVAVLAQVALILAQLVDPAIVIWMTRDMVLVN